MSLLMFAHAPEEFLVVTDTLATTESGEPAFFVDKCWPLVSMNMLVAATGSWNLATRWVDRLRTSVLARDITMLDQHAPTALRELWRELHAEFKGLSGTATIYHFGIEEETGSAVRIVYRSENDFVSERHSEGGFGVKPPPKEMLPPDSLEGWVDMACDIRAEQDALPAHERLYIGGDLVANSLTTAGFSSNRIHRFADYDAQWSQMCRALIEPADGDI